MGVLIIFTLKIKISHHGNIQFQFVKEHMVLHWLVRLPQVTICYGHPKQSKTVLK